MNMITFDKDYVWKVAKELLQIDSPSGFTHHAISYIESQIQTFGFQYEKSKKGNLHVYVDGKKTEKTIGLSAHCDTLGLMVRSINSDGTLAVTNIGGPTLPTLDGAYCRIITRNQHVYTGTILCRSASKHVHEDASTAPRDLHTLIVRIDEIVHSKEDVQALGIEHGDMIAIDPKVEITTSDFIKSRFLDDKISVAALLGLLHAIHHHKLMPSYPLVFIFSTYEEVGHGASYIPPNIDELISVDMGCIGEDLACTEYDVSICAKDSSGPYDYTITTNLITLAKQQNLAYAVDIYPMYGSDVSACLRAGYDIKGALIGPGVHASHGMERTHYQAIENTMKLLLAYITM